MKCLHETELFYRHKSYLVDRSRTYFRMCKHSIYPLSSFFMETEIWRDIPNYEWKYMVSDLWRIKSLNYNRTWESKIRKLNIRKDKYVILELCKDWIRSSFRLNRIVASVFHWLDMDDPYQLACHKDDDPSNNRADNIFVWTHKDNMQDMIKKWREKHQRWEESVSAKLNSKQIQDIRTFYSNWILSQTKIAKIYWVDQSLISLIVRNKRWNTL